MRGDSLRIQQGEKAGGVLPRDDGLSMCATWGHQACKAEQPNKRSQRYWRISTFRDSFGCSPFVTCSGHLRDVRRVQSVRRMLQAKGVNLLFGNAPRLCRIHGPGMISFRIVSEHHCSGLLFARVLSLPLDALPTRQNGLIQWPVALQYPNMCHRGLQQLTAVDAPLSETCHGQVRRAA